MTLFFESFFPLGVFSGTQNSHLAENAEAQRRGESQEKMLFLRVLLVVGCWFFPGFPSLGCSSASPRSPRLREKAVGGFSVSPCLREIFGCWSFFGSGFAGLCLLCALCVFFEMRELFLLFSSSDPFD